MTHERGWRVRRGFLSPHGRWHLSRVAVALSLACLTAELILLASDAGLLDVRRLRSMAYAYGAVWPGLLSDWTSNYPGQSAAMFFTYAFLHIDLAHVLTNIATLLVFASPVQERVGEWRLAAIYLASMLGGAAAYGLLAPGLVPMVGASGAVFGLGGALVAWDIADRRRARRSIWPAVMIGVYLNSLNVVMWLVMDGHLAWQTHVGGFLAGGLAALALNRAHPA